MKINIVYMTKSGTTEKLAKVIGEVVKVEPINAKTPYCLEGTDLLFIGTGIYGGKPSEEFINYLDTLPVNKIKAAVIFSSCWRGKDQTQLIVNVLKRKGIELYPERFVCHSKFLFLNKNKPDNNDLARLRELAYKVMNSINQAR